MIARGALVAFAVAALLAAPTALAEVVETEAKIKNKDPAIAGIELLDDEPGAAGYQVQPVAGGTKTVSVKVTTSDGNGNADIEKVTFSVERPDGTALHPAATAAAASSQGTVKTFTATFPLEFHEPPGTYTVHARVEDVKGGEAAATQAFEVQALLAFDPSPRSVGFAASDLEPDTSSPVAGVAIRNLGNVPLDVQVSGTDMQAASADAEIGVERVKFGLDEGLADAAPLATTPIALDGFDLAPGADSRRSLYFRVDVPSGEDQFIPADTYQGSITVGAGVSS